MPEFEQALVLELRIGFGNGVVADHEIFRQSADSRQLISMLQNACFDAMPDLLHQLQVEGLAGGWVELEGQFTVPLLVYSDRADKSTGGGRGSEAILRHIVHHAQRL
jgi:hypothetical protein